MIHSQNKFFIIKYTSALLVGIFFIFIGNSLQAQKSAATVELSPSLQKAYFDIQKLKLDDARISIQEAKIKVPNNLFVEYLENYADIHALLITENKKNYNSYLTNTEIRQQRLERLPKNTPYKRFFQAELRIHTAFVKIKFGNEISGAWDVIKAFKLLEENKKYHPDFKPTFKSLGLLHILIGSVPDQYTWVTKILGLKGNIDLGVREIRMVAQTASLFSQEAKLIDILIHAYTLGLESGQLEQLISMSNKQPDNLLLIFFTATTLIKENKGEMALEFLNHAPRSKDYLEFPLIDYLKAEILLQKEEYLQAKVLYKRFLSNHYGINYIKDAYLKLYMCDWLGGQNNNSTYLNEVISKGNTVMEADKMANRFAKEIKAGKFSNENKLLFKARYATDGGFLLKANEILDKVSEGTFASNDNKVEFNYRKGRLAQKNKDLNIAVTFYFRTLEITNENTTGLGAAAALQLGTIFQSQGNLAKALKYYKLATTFKNHDYKSSIDNKARAAISGIDK